MDKEVMKNYENYVYDPKRSPTSPNVPSVDLACLQGNITHLSARVMELEKVINSLMRIYDFNVVKCSDCGSFMKEPYAKELGEGINDAVLCESCYECRKNEFEGFAKVDDIKIGKIEK